MQTEYSKPRKWFSIFEVPIDSFYNETIEHCQSYYNKGIYQKDTLCDTERINPSSSTNYKNRIQIKIRLTDFLVDNWKRKIQFMKKNVIMVHACNIHMVYGSKKVTAVKIKLIRDKTSGQPLGYGFLEFDSAEAASNALMILNGQQMSDTTKIFKLNWASNSPNKQTVQNSGENSIYVCELDPSVSEEQLKNLFGQIYQSVLGAKIIIDPITKISKGYGFVKFGDLAESQKALTEMNGKMINGKPMKTNQASFKKGGFESSNNKKGLNNMNQGFIDPYNQMNGVLNPQQSQEQNLNIYNQSMAGMQNYFNSFYMANGYYPPYNMNPMYYQMYAAGLYPQQNLPQTQSQANNQYSNQDQQ